jgi:hypothetical protein
LFSRNAEKAVIHFYYEESGWDGWPKAAKQEDVLSWIAQINEQFANFAEDHKSS